MPWCDLSCVEKGEVRRSAGSGSGRGILMDAISFRLKSGLNYSFPKIMRNVEGCSLDKINFVEKTINEGIEFLIDKLNQMKSKYDSSI